MDYFDILLAKKLEGGGGGDVTIEQLDVTENGTYSEPGKAYRPVIVNLPLDEKTITANGTYNASDDNLQGFNKVVINVSGFKLKDMTPGAIASFNDGQALPLTKLLIDIEPVQAGSGDPSPNNERLISGWSTANINVTGANVWNEEWEIGTYDLNTGEKVEYSTYFRNKNLISVKPDTSYYAHTNGKNLYRLFYDKNKTYLGYIGGTIDRTFTTPNNAYYLNFVCVNSNTYNNDISINYPATVTSYHTHDANAKIINVVFTDSGSPLIVYGGTLDVITGVLTVDRVIIDLGSLNWSKVSGQNKFYVSFNNAVKFHTLNSPDQNIPENFMCSGYKLVGGKDAYDCVYDLTIGGSYFNNSNYLLVNDSNYSNAEDFKTGVQGVKLVYELATPETYQLTPTQVNALLGVNNIFADTGDILEGQYFAAL